MKLTLLACKQKETLLARFHAKKNIKKVKYTLNTGTFHLKCN